MTAAIILVAAALTGCMTELAPEVGPPVRPACEDIDSDPDTSVEFERDVRPILEQRGHCDACHTPDGRTPFGLELTGFDVSTRESLLAGGAQSGTAVVVPGRPCASILVHKALPNPPFGARMPLDGPPYLDGTSLQIIADWIAEGAP
jgi:hypothetical protein